ncbi:MAG: DNA repair protein RecN [Burkholderiales bacterium]|nr:DNA repair protein RecN [Burkholderiales bacterium]
MLLHLSIREFAIVDRLELDFAGGFTALTGETGAGKSILIDALALALGERADADVVRAGADRAEVIAEFATDGARGLDAWLAEAALEGDPGRLLLRRVVDRNGRSRAFVNGHAATVQQLREASDALVDVHGQHAHQSLLRTDAQRDLLDGHAGLAKLAADVAAAYRAWRAAASARTGYEKDASARTAERDRIAWQADELARIAAKEGEWDALSQEHSRLAHAASLAEGAQAALDAVSEADGSASAAVSSAASRIRALVQYDASLGEILAMLESASAQLQEAGYGLRHYRDRVELDPARLRDVEARIDALHGAGRKFRVPPSELPILAASLAEQLARLDVAVDPDALIAAETAAREQYETLAAKLSAERKAAAAKLGKQVTAAMKELAMSGGRFEVALNAVEAGSPGGNEEVEFQVTTNPGMPARPLAKVASGGELSRLSLAIQVITSRSARVPTMIFDEVDSGIGGAVAEIVGRKMKALGADRQVLCVTHLPQVAAQADHQWSVAKGAMNGVVRSQVTPLEGKARIEELARMLGGTEITATTRKHAAELLEQGGR